MLPSKQWKSLSWRAQIFGGRPAINNFKQNFLSSSLMTNLVSKTKRFQVQRGCGFTSISKSWIHMLMTRLAYTHFESNTGPKWSKYKFWVSIPTKITRGRIYGNICTNLAAQDIQDHPVLVTIWEYCKVNKKTILDW